MAIFYEVTCVLPDVGVRDPYFAWLRDAHVGEVCRAGALSGTLLLPDDEPLSVRVVYIFSSREALATYERDEAPRLREEVLRELTKLGAEGQVVMFERTRGEALAITSP